MVQRVRASLARCGAPPCPHVLVGFSGGQDSLALTLVLTALARAGALTVDVLHVDHAFRATSADAAAGVRAIGDALGLETHTITLDPALVARHAGVGAEEALRRERYRAFATVAQATDAFAVATAHHQRDQAETVLLHLMRGSGLSGAAGMRECAELTVPWWGSASEVGTSLKIWRPFIAERFDDVAVLASESGFPVYEDETNDERRFRRNAVRHDVLPVLESLSPGATQNLARFADLAAEDETELDRLVRASIQHEAVIADGTINRARLIRFSRAIQRRIVRTWIIDSGYDGDLMANRVDAVLDAAERNRSGASVQIGSGLTVWIQNGRLVLQR